MEQTWKLLGFANATKEFHPAHTFFNGQCFNWVQVESVYVSVFQHRLLEVQTHPKGLQYRLTPDTDDLEAALTAYLQLDVSMQSLFTQWIQADSNLQPATNAKQGMRVLRQDPWECTISFICSQNNNIKRITKMLDSLRTRFGQLIAHKYERDWFTFPSLAHLSQASLADLKGLGLGYRAEYVYKTCNQVRAKGGEDWLNGLRGQSSASSELMELAGVGPKVADCIALFALDARARVPIDVHMWRVAKGLFPQELGSYANLNRESYELTNRLFRERYGEYAGWAHSYLSYRLLYSEAISPPVKRKNPSPERPTKRPKP